ncbi:MAG: nucleotidyltransferase family protein [Paucibacter sp.]|nr:nucleotidyltransferase family protein [Roseateles sp.]
MPPAEVVARALACTTETLVREVTLAGPRAPQWSAFEWRAAMAASTIHGLSALLATRLRWQGPPEWQAFLAEQLAQSVEREQRIRVLRVRIDEAAREAGVSLVGLKGSALLPLKLYAAGERPMSDIDLLVREGDLETAAVLIESLGYERGAASPRHTVFRPLRSCADPAFGEHPDNPIKIELHPRVAEQLPVREADITALCWPADARPGLNAYPSHAALLRHLLLHAAGNLMSRSLRLTQLLDIARLAPRLDAGDWAELEGCLGWWALPPLLMLGHYFPTRLPAPLSARLLRECPRRLQRAMERQRLAQVSLCRMDHPAFPGIEWAQSPAEALRYVAQRLLPKREDRARMQQLARSEPVLASTSWTAKSRAEKALRWMLVKPPRVQTMYSVQKALAYRPRAAA